ncbi:MAG: DUF4403 family protein [Deltaproteobacteria bacterium]|nr:DUF4403 family protein [Deltaproteobacteria bacterium]
MRSPFVVVVVALAAACGTTPDGPTTTAEKASLYPKAPPAQSSPPLADPPLQRPTMHLTLTREGLQALLDALVPMTDTGNYALLGARAWSWKRTPFALAFDDARKSMTATTDVTASVEVPGTSMEIAMKVAADVQPVFTAQHKLVLQAVKVSVRSDDRRIKMAEFGAGLVAHVEKTLQDKLTTLQVDLAPAFGALHEKLGAPMFLSLGEASACFTLDVRGIEASPSILADGLEKELAITVAPSLTMPCTVPGKDGGMVTLSGPPAPGVEPATPAARELPPLPALRNSSGIEGGPFTLTIPIAAGYVELQKAMLSAFPEGKLFFSTENPGLYITDPRVSSSAGEVVVAVRVAGFVEKGIRVDVDGDLFLTGRPAVRDNFLEFPDLKPSIETEQALLAMAIAFKEVELTAAVRKALRLDLSARLAAVKHKLVDALSMEKIVVDGVPPLCTRAELGRLELKDIAVHDPYLRATVTTTALLSASLPCVGGTLKPPAVGVAD